MWYDRMISWEIFCEIQGIIGGIMLQLHKSFDPVVWRLRVISPT